jgi:lipopolysaccharide/colanic/teichoic acid biosynthesis glycosyltransferase
MKFKVFVVLSLVCVSRVAFSSDGALPEQNHILTFGNIPSHKSAPQEPASEIPSTEETLEAELHDVRTGLTRTVYVTRWKRRIDQAMVLALALPAAALSSVVAFTIKAVDGGPVLFIQKRAGLHGKPFWIIKFKTLRRGQPTRLGWWLRRTRLDEIPQLWNVWKGEMSLVGPRPLVFEDAERLRSHNADFAFREEVLPGMAGLAQVEGATYARETQCKAILLDKQYVCRVSFLQDLIIVGRGVGALLMGKCPP